MPHFILDCSEEITRLQAPQKVLQAVFDIAVDTGLFEPENIKVRLNPYSKDLFLTSGRKDDFIHVFANIMEGRTTAQKSDLSRRIATLLSELFPNVPVISINIRDFEKATYCNKGML